MAGRADVFVPGGEAVVLHGLLQEGFELSLRVFGPGLDHHAAVAPCRGAAAGTHAVDHHLSGAAGRGHHESAGAHAETVDSAAFALGYVAVFCRR